MLKRHLNMVSSCEIETLVCKDQNWQAIWLANMQAVRMLYVGLIIVRCCAEVRRTTVKVWLYVQTKGINAASTQQRQLQHRVTWGTAGN